MFHLYILENKPDTLYYVFNKNRSKKLCISFYQESPNISTKTCQVCLRFSIDFCIALFFFANDVSAVHARFIKMYLYKMYLPLYVPSLGTTHE